MNNYRYTNDKYLANSTYYSTNSTNTSFSPNISYTQTNPLVQSAALTPTLTDIPPNYMASGIKNSQQVYLQPQQQIQALPQKQYQPQYQIISQTIKEPIVVSMKSSYMGSELNDTEYSLELNKNIKCGYNELQLRIVMLCAEIDRLTIANSLNLKELEYWRDKSQAVQRDSHFRNQQVRLLNKIYDIGSHYQDNEVLILRKRTAELEKNIGVLAQETQRLRNIENISNEKDKEIQKLRGRVDELEGIYRKQMEQLSKTIEGQEEIITKLKHENERLAKTSASFTNLDELQKVREDLERKLLQIGTENERVNNLLIKKVKEFDDLQAKTMMLKNENDRLNALVNGLEQKEQSRLDEKVKQLSMEILRLNDELMKRLNLEHELRSVQNQNNDYEARIAALNDNLNIFQQENNKLASEIQRLSEMLNATSFKEQELEEWKQKHAFLESQSKKDIEALKIHLENSNNTKLETQKRLGAAQMLNKDETIKTFEAKLSQALEEIKVKDQEIKDLMVKGQVENEVVPSLRKEIENWKIKYDQLEKSNIAELAQLKYKLEAFLAQQLQEERTGYEAKINEMEEEFETKLKGLQAENKKLLVDLDELKTRIQKRKDDTKVEIESNLRSQYESQIKDLQLKLEKAKDDYESLNKQLKVSIDNLDMKNRSANQEIEKLKGILGERDAEINHLKKNEHLEMANRSLVEEINQLKSKLAKYIDEIKKLNEMNEQKDSEILRLMNNCEQSQQRAEDYITKTLEEINLQIKVRLEKEKADVKAQIAKERADIEAQAKLLNQRINEYENRVYELTEENEMLNNRLAKQADDLSAKYANIDKSRLREIEDLKNDLENIRSQMDEHISTITQDFGVRQVLFFIEIERRLLIAQELTEQLESYQTDYNNLLNAYNELSSKQGTPYNDYERKINELERAIEDRDMTIKTLLEENSRLSDLSFQRLKEIDGLKIKYMQGIEGENGLSNYNEDYYHQRDSYLKQYEDAKEQINKLENDNKILQIQLKNLNLVYENTQNEINRLNNLLEQKRQDYDMLYKKVSIITYFSIYIQDIIY